MPPHPTLNGRWLKCQALYSNKAILLFSSLDSSKTHLIHIRSYVPVLDQSDEAPHTNGDIEATDGDN